MGLLPQPRAPVRSSRNGRPRLRGGSANAPGKIRTCDLSLRRNEKEEAKEAQKWLWQARYAVARRRTDTYGYAPIWGRLGY
jgi:hypothetical protein